MNAPSRGAVGAAPLIAGIAVPIALALGIACAAAASGAVSSSPAQGITSCPAAPVRDGRAVAGVTLTTAQLSDARVIYDVSVSMGLPQRAAVIAEATAMQESRLLDLPGGTADSLGLFQQRPSQGWGTPAQIMQPVYAATRFYQALARIPGWQSLPLTVAAQDVQHSAHPGAYAKWRGLAGDLTATFSGTAAGCLTGNGGGVPAGGTTKVPAGFSLPPGTPPVVVTAVTYALAQLGKPYIWGGTGPAGYDCSGLVMMAWAAAGITLPRTTFQQVYAGTPVYSLARLRPGDLMFTPGSDGTAEHPGHEGMFIGTFHGQGLVVQASQAGSPVEITLLAGYWARQTVAVRRVA